jgi:hypothetical protein
VLRWQPGERRVGQRHGNRVGRERDTGHDVVPEPRGAVIGAPPATSTA